MCSLSAGCCSSIISQIQDRDISETHLSLTRDHNSTASGIVSRHFGWECGVRLWNPAVDLFVNEKEVEHEMGSVAMMTDFVDFDEDTGLALIVAEFVCLIALLVRFVEKVLVREGTELSLRRLV